MILFPASEQHHYDHQYALRRMTLGDGDQGTSAFCWAIWNGRSQDEALASEESMKPSVLHFRFSVFVPWNQRLEVKRNDVTHPILSVQHCVQDLPEWFFLNSKVLKILRSRLSCSKTHPSFGLSVLPRLLEYLNSRLGYHKIDVVALRSSNRVSFPEQAVAHLPDTYAFCHPVHQ